MVARSYERGWPLVYIRGAWRYADTGEPASDNRACRRCGRKPSADGHDACLGTLADVTSACCGHGSEVAYVQSTRAVFGGE